MIAVFLLLVANADVCRPPPLAHKRIPSVRPARHVDDDDATAAPQPTRHRPAKATVVAEAASDTPVNVPAQLPASAPALSPAAPADDATAKPPAAPPPLFKRSEAQLAPSSNNDRLAKGLVLFGVMGLIAIAAMKMKKRRAKHEDAATHIDVIASHAFSPKQRMNVVQIGNERMLVAVSDKGIQLLCGLKPDQSVSFEQALTLADRGEEPAAATPATDADLPRAPSPEIAGILRLRRARELGGRPS